MLVASLEHHSSAPLIAPKICARVGDNARTSAQGWSGANLAEENYYESQEKPFNRTTFQPFSEFPLIFNNFAPINSTIWKLIYPGYYSHYYLPALLPSFFI